MTTERKRGRPRELHRTRLVAVRLPTALIAEIDAEIPFVAEERYGETAKRAMVIRLLLHEALQARRAGRGEE